MNKAWQQANRQQLLADLQLIAQSLLQQAETSAKPEDNFSNVNAAELAEVDRLPSALAQLCTRFKLSEFERKVLLLCVGMELRNDFALLCANALPEGLPYPTPALALSAFPEGDWQAFASNAPLLRWQLVELANGASLMHKRLFINERIWQYLLGLPGFDARLEGIIQPLKHEDVLNSAQADLVSKMLELWPEKQLEPQQVCMNLYGSDDEAKEQVAVEFCRRLKRQPYQIAARLLPSQAHDLEYLQRLLLREVLLNDSLYVVTWHNVAAHDFNRLSGLVNKLSGHCLLLGKEPLADFDYPVVNLHVSSLSYTEQLTLWQQLLHAEHNPGITNLGKLAMQFNLTARQIKTIATAVNAAPAGENEKRLWDYCRQQARRQVSNMIKQIEPKAGWENLVLPPAQLALLHSITAHVKQRYKVYQEWGFAVKHTRGLGTCVLLAGPSGTGKTLTAEVLAKELQLDLYQVDLSAVISKYIGETEKNLEKVFSEAESSGAVLLFDEADALFGKRSEVKDSRDRYANIEVGYLLQRIESYRGLSILTTNLKDSIDDAFIRRFHFILQVSFPNAEQRLQIWQQIFPPQAAVKDLDFTGLAQLNITGGNITSIALNAAFIAAEAAEPITMTHTLQAVRNEYAKLRQTLTETELANWV
jgi:hypothetical protein